MRKLFHSIALAGISTASLLAIPAHAEDDFSIGESGVALSLGDDALEIELGGKVQLDGYTYDLGLAGDTNADFRRVRPDLRVRIADVIRLRAEWEFSGSEGWRNLYAEVEPSDGVTLRGGNFSAPFSMEDMQGSAVIPFAERSLVATISPGFGLGGQVGYSTRRFTARVGWFDDALDSEEGRSAEHGKGWVGRVTFLAIDTDDTKLHLGLAGESRSFDAAESLRYGATAGTTFAPGLLTTTRLTDVSSLDAVNAELGFIAGPLALQGQYVHQWIDQRTLPDTSISAGYVQAGWMLTGEGYRYARGGGTLSGPRIRDDMAVELAARFSWLDAGDAPLGGEKAETLDATAALHLASWARIMLSGTKGRKRDTLGGREKLTVGLVRLQLSF